jgi:hypothetical protein
MSNDESEYIRRYRTLVCMVADELMDSNTHSDTDVMVPLHTFRCPITLMAMKQPTSLPDGSVFELSAIIQHFKLNGYTNPMTNETMQLPFTLNPVKHISALMERWCTREACYCLGRFVNPNTSFEEKAALFLEFLGLTELPDACGSQQSALALPKPNPNPSMNIEVIGADEDEAEADDEETIPDIQTYQALQDADTIPNPPSPPGAPRLDRYPSRQARIERAAALRVALRMATFSAQSILAEFAEEGDGLSNEEQTTRMDTSFHAEE